MMKVTQLLITQIAGHFAAGGEDWAKLYRFHRENVAKNPYLFFVSTKAAEVKRMRSIKIGQSATLFASGAVMAVAPIHG